MIPNFVPSPEYWTVRKWLAKALADGSMQCKPDAKIVGHGLDSIQAGFDILRKGVSAAKVVITI